MPNPFPSDRWIKALQEQLNTSPAYGEVARNWEGDILFELHWPDGSQPTRLLYVDLWHGHCRQAYEVAGEHALKPALRLSAPMEHWVKILTGKLEPMQALMTGKIKIQGNMILLMKNVPTVLEFVRQCQQIETEFPTV